MRGTPTDCFICLNKTTNRICPYCQCFAHSVCWGKYVKNINDEAYMTISEGNIGLLARYSFPCPICKRDLKTLPPITRGHTKEVRRNIAFIDISLAIEYADQDEISPQEKFERYHIIMREFKMAKKIIRENPRISRMIKMKISDLYYNEDWKIANQYHIDIFGHQIDYPENEYHRICEYVYH